MELGGAARVSSIHPAASNEQQHLRLQAGIEDVATMQAIIHRCGIITALTLLRSLKLLTLLSLLSLSSWPFLSVPSQSKAGDASFHQCLRLTKPVIIIVHFVCAHVCVWLTRA